MARVAIPVRGNGGSEDVLLVTSNNQGDILFVLNPDLSEENEAGPERAAQGVFVLPNEAVALVVKDAEVGEMLYLRDEALKQATGQKLIVPTASPDPAVLRDLHDRAR